MPDRLARLPELGVGITFSAGIMPLIASPDRLVDMVEVEPQTLWSESRVDGRNLRVDPRVTELLVGLPCRKTVHSIGVPVGGSISPDPEQIALLRDTIVALDAPWVSEHLSFNRVADHATGFFLPPRQNASGVAAAVAATRRLQALLPVPLAIETGVNYLRPRPDEMEDGAFVAAVVEGADCGLLLDLHNLFTNAANGRQPVADFVRQVPLERVIEVHLAGGLEMDGLWLDAHSGAMPEALVALAGPIIARLPNLKAIVFEIYASFIEVAGLDLIRRQLELLRGLWDLRGRDVAGPRPAAAVPAPADVDGGLSAEAWEQALGALAIGRPAPVAGAEAVAADPGMALVRRLVLEFRASMVVGTLRLTSRLLMLALGPDVFRGLLQAYWLENPPEQFASSEADAFGAYLDGLNLAVPHLAEVLGYERAVLATLLDQEPHTVRFSSDPVPLLRALADGHLPAEVGAPGDFEVEITPDDAGALAGSPSAPTAIAPLH